MGRKKLWHSLALHVLSALVTLWVFALQQPSVVFALDPNKAITQYIHEVWQTEDGLPHDSITAILQTRDNYIWLGTGGGLVRFDGVRFKVFDKMNTPALKHNYVTSLFEDKEGSLWIGTEGGLCQTKNGKFMSYCTKEGLSHDYVMSLSGDKKGNLWIGTESGLCQMKDGKFTSFTKKEGLISENVRVVFVDREGSVWIGTYGGGLGQKKGDKFSFYTIKDGLTTNFVLSICEDLEGNIWAGTFGGLNRIKNGKLTSFTTKEGLPHSVVRTLLTDKEGNLWIGSYGGGLSRLKDEKFTSFTSQEGLSHDLVMSLYEDKMECLWIGTYGSGLNRLKDGKFLTYTTKEGLAFDYIMSVHECRDRSLWIGTGGGGFNCLKDGRLNCYSTKDGLSRDLVMSVFEDSKGGLWLGTGGGGLNLFKDGKFTVYTMKDGLSHDFIRAIYESSDGSIWIGTHGGGLNRYKNGRFTSYTTKNGLSHNLVMSIYEDKEKNLWVGTGGGGLNCLKNGKFKYYTTRDGLSRDFVRVLYGDNDGNIWIGTHGGGLNRLKDGKFTSYTMKHGLYDDAIYQILEDDKGNLWMGCRKGIFRVSKKELNDFAEGKTDSITSIFYNKADGMRSSECTAGTQPGACKTKDGKLCFPTLKGLVMIDTENIKLNTQPPPVVIEEFIVDNEIIDLGEKVRISPGKQRFEIHYTGLSFLVPERVMFKYKLEGFEEDWVDAGTRRTAYYTSIHPGHYIFKVKACNNDGIWNDKGASYEFFLKPYFYQTTLFYILCGLGVVSVSLGGFRLRVRQMKAREKQLTLLVEGRTQELSKVMKQLEKANTELEQLSLTDRLTDIANRRHFEIALDREWRRCLREGLHMSLIMVDIDFFKPYNDTYGHLKGDECLKHIAGVLKNSARRPGDIAVRYGGEEFAVVLSNTDSGGANTVAEKIRSKVEELNIPHESSSVNAHVTISAGAATLTPTRDSSPDMLISIADLALYQAKKKGRNCVVSEGL